MRGTGLGMTVAGLIVMSLSGALGQPSELVQATGTADTRCGTQVGAQPGYGQWEHLTVVIFENKTLPKIIGNTQDAPYLTSLARACSYATNMHHMTTTSLTNYIALTSGYTGHSGGKEVLITGTKLPRIWPQDSVSIFEAMGPDAREWAESMPSNCFMGNSGDLFEVGHTPFQYYTRTQKTLCPMYAIPLGSHNAMSAKFNLVIPNRVNIMHGTSATTTASERIQAGDRWASTFIPALLASSEYAAGKSAVIITFDEGDSKSSQIPFIVISPYTQAGGTTNVAYNHYSTLAGVQQMLGVSPLLGHAGDAGVNSIADDATLGLG
ncbi:alkaline phosphatase family protein [Knoellia pratensis]|uniref:alkaline phosphatase family protein n=1 Tax=Knoellia pratensis TaxID=3404796 RepID=UPI00361E200C